MGILSSSHKSEALRANLRSAVSRGFHTGNLPFGYTYPPRDSYDQTAVIVEEEAAVVRETYRLALANRTLAEIVIILEQKGMRGRNDYLSKSSIHSILNNPYYAGVVRLNGELYPGAHQALVSLADFGEVVKKITSRKSVPLRTRLG